MVRQDRQTSPGNTSARLTHWNGVDDRQTSRVTSAALLLEWCGDRETPLILLCLLLTTVLRGGLRVEMWGILVSSKGESPTCEPVSLLRGKLELMPCEYR